MKVSSASWKVTSSVSANHTCPNTSPPVLAATGPSRKSQHGPSRVDVFRTARSNKTLTFPRRMRRLAHARWRKLRHAPLRLGLLRAARADLTPLTVSSRVLLVTPARDTSGDTRATRAAAAVKRNRTRVLSCTMRLADRRDLDARRWSGAPSQHLVGADQLLRGRQVWRKNVARRDVAGGTGRGVVSMYRVAFPDCVRDDERYDLCKERL
jgi:hypothetical protein